MKKRILSMLIVLVLVLGLFPVSASAAPGDPGTLQFSTNLNTEPYGIAYQGSVQLSAAVGTYTPAGGSPTALPEGTVVSYVWYNSADNVADSGDTRNYNGSGTNCYFSDRSAAAGSVRYCYVVATATIDGVQYTGTSNVAAIKIGAQNVNVLLTVSDRGTLAQDKDGKAVCAVSVSAVDYDYDGKVTYDEALIAAHTKLKTRADYATSQSNWGLFVTKLWGVETSNLSFYKDGEAIALGVGDTTVTRNNNLYVSINADQYSADYFTQFDKTTTSITEGMDIELTLKDEKSNPVPGMSIGTWESGVFHAIEGKTTDADGKVTLGFDTAGTYVISASGTVLATATDWSLGTPTDIPNHECPIMAPGCSVTVQKAGELKFNGRFPAKAFDVKVGEKFNFSSLIYARYYIDDVLTSNSNVKLSAAQWYRVGPKSGGVAERVADINAIITSEDVGTWQYYIYAECDAYGQHYTAMSNMATVIISEPTAIPGSAENGFVKDITYNSGGTASGLIHDFEFEEGKTDYTITHFEKGANDSILIKSPHGKNLWFGYRINGIKDTVGWNSADQELKATYYLNGFSISVPDSFEAGNADILTVIVGTKYDSNEDGYIKAEDDFYEYDVYNFTVNTIPCLSSLNVSDGANNAVTLDNTISAYGTYWASDLYGSAATDTIKLTANFSGAKGVKLYLGNEVEPYTENLNAKEISLASYKDASGIANIPLKLVKERNDGSKAEHTATLHITPVADFEGPEIITQPVSELNVEKKAPFTLTIAVREPEQGVLSYQWYGGNSEWNSSIIKGATSASYESQGGELAGEYYYFCKVTLTKNGASATSTSDVSKVTTNLTYVNDAVFTIQPGILNNKDGAGSYCTEYSSGRTFDPMWLAVDGKQVRINGTYVAVTETGCDPYTVECYYNSEASTEGGTLIPGTYTPAASGGGFGNYFSFIPDYGLPEGTHYVYFAVTSVASDDAEKKSVSYSDFVKLTYGPATLPLEGSGSEEDPFLLKSGDDFVILQQHVEQGDTLSGLYFQMANDITLPADWESIGSNGPQGKFFGGIIDGAEHTLTYPRGSKGLIHHAKNAILKNIKIYGEEISEPALIASSWTNQTVGAWIARIDNITLLSGTSTLMSGLVNGSASTYNPIYINNCRAEAGVVIGYDKQQSGIGTFAGSFLGRITNCHSAATIYGVNRVGGIFGSSSNSMGAGNLTNLWFTGTIVATGKSVGGLVGAGYNSNSAPNALAVSIQNCYVSASITGRQYVGGLLGADGGIQQAWDNGIGYIRNNVFYGTLTGETCVGGLVGYYAALNKYNVIENNYFYDTNGHTDAIGGVEHIDTSARPFGMNDDGIFYYDTSKDSIADIKEFVDAEDKGTSDWQYTSVVKTDHNRTDDPMGADKEKLGKAVTAEEMRDGTVLALLNNSETSKKNWIQGEKHPVIDERAYITSLELSGNYKTEYYIGDTFDTTGMVFKAVWSDDSVTDVDIADVTITGFNSGSRASLVITASYSGVETQFVVNVVKRPSSGGDVNTITVYFTLLGDTIHYDEDGNVNLTGETHTLKSGNLETWIARKAYVVDINATAWDLIQTALADNNMSCEYTYSLNTVYVESVTRGNLTIGEFDNGNLSGWMYTLNGKHPVLGVAQQYLENGDEIVFHYTDDYTVEEGSEKYNGGGSGGGSSSSEKKDDKTEDKDKPSETAPAAEKVVETVKVEAKADAKGVAKAEVKTADVTKAVKSAAEKKADSIVIAPEITGEAKEVKVELPKASVSEIVKNTSASLVIETGTGSVEVPNEVLKEIAEQADGANVEISVADKSVEDAGVKEAIADKLGDDVKTDNAAVAEITVTSGNEKITTFGGNSIKASVSVDGKQGFVEGKKYVTVVISADGKKEVLVGTCTKGADGKLHVDVTVKHLSTFVVLDKLVKTFADAEAHWSADAVDFAVANGLMNGTSDTAFAPNMTLNRAMLVTILYRLAGSPVAMATDKFTDVAAGQWYSEAVAWAAANGIVTGKTETSFAPMENITREQFATMLMRYCKFAGLDVNNAADLGAFTDAATISAYAKDALAWANAAGIITGRTATTIAPTGSATRGEAATMLMRFMQM